MRAILFTLFVSSLVLYASAQPNKDGIDGIYYNLNTSALTAEVTFCHFYADDAESSYMYDGSNWNYAYSQYKYKGELTIPETIEYEGKRYNVTALGNNALYGCSGLTKLNLPKTLATFGNGWTSGCTALQSVAIDVNNPTFRVVNNIVLKGNNIQYVPMGVTGTVTVPECVTTITNEAFDNHKSITKIVLHNNITFIQEGSFNGCSSLSDINLPTSITTIENKCFYNCTSLKSIYIPSNVKSIGSHAFTGSALKNVNLSEGLTTIDDYAFYNISTLENINIPNSLTTIGDNAFNGCSGIKELHFGKSLKSIGTNALNSVHPGIYTVHDDNTMYSCVSGIVYNKAKTRIAFIPSTFPDEVTIPGTLIEIPEGLFAWHNNISTATIEEGINTIPDDMFTNCQGLTTVNIPASVNTISWSAFDGCIALETLHISPSNTTYSCVGPLILTDNSTKIDQCLPSAVDVNVPSSVTALYGDVFVVCDNLNSVTFQTQAPPSLDGALDYVELNNANCTIYVPNGTERAYASAFNIDSAVVRPANNTPTGINNPTEQYELQRARLTSKKGNVIIQSGGENYSLYGRKIM